MKVDKRQNLYPTIGVVLNEVAALFYSKPPYTDNANHPDYRAARRIDGLSGYGAFKLDYSTINQSIDRVFTAPFSSHESDFSIFLRNCGHAIIGQYIHMIREYPLDGFDRDQIIPWLVENHVCKFICDAIGSVKRAHSVKWQNLFFFKNKLPIKTVFDWLEGEFPEYIKFKKDFGMTGQDIWIVIKAERDKIGKWTKGVDIPTNKSLWGNDGVLLSFYEKHRISEENQTIINEAFFLARVLQVFYRKSAHLNAFENLQKMANNQYIYVPETVLLQHYLKEPSDLIIEKIEPYLCYLEELRELLVNTQARESGDREKALRFIELAEKELEDNVQYNPNWWHLGRFRGLWYEFNGETEKAIVSYIEAIDGFLYSGGKHVKRALQEALVLCCARYLRGGKKVKSTNLKSYIKRLRSQGRIFDYYPPWGLDEEEMPEEEIRIMAGYYSQYFPKSKMF